jgi:hypothetical protein
MWRVDVSSKIISRGIIFEKKNIYLLETQNNDMDIFNFVLWISKKVSIYTQYTTEKDICQVIFFHPLYTVHQIYEKSRSGNKAGAIHVQIYKTTHIQLDDILTQSEAKLLLYVLKSFAGWYQLQNKI